ncbi:MAG: GSCFA domain-containing protein [Pseudomonadota bacterium]|nr:GSCFA domain-containing protein [Pseudomonadota bacterium]
MMRHVEVRKTANYRWKRFFEDRCMTVERAPIVGPEDKIFAMGSCFSREIRNALVRRKYLVGPDYSNIPINELIYAIDELPERNHINFYNTFTVLQEFERLSGRWTQERDDYWSISRKQFGSDHCFQDPYRRLTFGSTPVNLCKANKYISDTIEKAARTSSVFIFTFGVAEVFRLKSNDRIAGQKPAHFGGGGTSETSLHMSTFAENLKNLETLYELIKQLNQNARIIVTVSPVPLERTFSGRDIVVANSDGKSLLRAVLSEFTQCYKDVFYFPAYEMVNSLGEKAYIPGDLRHVKKSVVDMIIQVFINAHMTDNYATTTLQPDPLISAS